MKTLPDRVKMIEGAARVIAPARYSWRTERQKTAERGYGSPWRRARAGWLRKHPLCVMCRAEGMMTPATVVDHITPHRGDKALFWDRANWQSLCKAHHDGAKARQERAAGQREGW